MSELQSAAASDSTVGEMLLGGDRGQSVPPSVAALIGGGELGALMRSVDWSSTPLGALERWPQSLRTTVSTCLNSRFPILVWWGPELVMLYNDAYVQLIGSKHPRALGAPGRTVFPEIWEIIGPMLRGVLAQGEATWSEDQLLELERHGFAEECYFTFSYSPIRDESGEVGGVFTAVTETTERVIGERRLATLRALAERTAAARTLDQATERALGVLADDTVDVPFVALYLVESDGSLARLAGAANLPTGVHCPPTVSLAGPEPTADEDVWSVARVARSGEPAVITVAPPEAARSSIRQAMVLPVASAGQRRPRAVLVAGTSPRRALADDYRGFLALVAGQVATALANAEAHEAERRRAESLAELDRAKTVFFSNVSHEFRTPLTLMLGPTEDALGDPDLSEANRARMEIVHRSALRLQRLVNSLLDFSRIEAGRIDALFRPTDLGAMTTELAATFQSAVERAGLTLVVDCPPLGAATYVDRAMWEKIVLNLLSNAFKHTFEGTIAVATRVRDGAVELIVRDTGVGISAEQLPRIFERFHRVPNARARSHEGTGIGLALVQELVRIHGGTIDVDSELGAGTTFTVRVPTGSAHLPADHVEEADLEPTPAGTSASYVSEALRWLPSADEGRTGAAGAQRPNADVTRGARVLIADDNSDMRVYVARLLGAQGWRVEATGDGTAALNAARRERPDLVLADVMMPNLDGFGLLRALREDAATATIPVILLSARAGEESRIEGLDAGADDYLVKPFSARELVARVAAHLALSMARARAAAAVARAHDELTVAHRQLQAQSQATEQALAEAEDARRIAESANRAKSEFLAAMSHELRTPLNAIAGYTELLEVGVYGPIGESQRGPLGRVRRSQQHLLSLINDVLNFAKLEAGRVEYATEEFPLADVVAEVSSMMEPQLRAKELRCTVRVDRDVVVRADREKVQQILLNLLSNAAKFTGAGGEIVVESVHRAGAPAGMVLLRVTDTGIGIARDKQDEIFDPFVQVHRDLTRTIEGTGLGLAISRDLARGMGGELRVRSHEGSGSSFTLSLPAA